MSILESLNWRYAAKKLNGSVVSDEKVEKIIEAARLAPTSSGLQPFEIFVVTNKALREKIKSVAYNQSQITDGSHLIVFAAWNNYTTDRINHYFDHYEQERDLPKGFSDGYKNGVTKQLTSLTEEQQFEHAARQVYIAFSFAMAEAAVLRVDASPMEGFVAAELDTLMRFEEKGLRSVLIMPLGYRDEENDWQANLKKVRKFPKDMIHYIK